MFQGNKGGVTIRMSLYGHTVCFINCHLPAHMENTEQRLDDFEKILELQFEGENIPSTLDHEWVVLTLFCPYCFYLLNGRLMYQRVWVWEFWCIIFILNTFSALILNIGRPGWKNWPEVYFARLFSSSLEEKRLHMPEAREL